MKAILAKLFGARDQLKRKRGVDDKEMPFLEHLEELRGTLMKVIITLIVFTIGAFTFRGPLLDIIRYPISLAGLGANIELPSGIGKEDWRKVEKLANSVRNLDAAVGSAFLDAALTEEEQHLRPYIDALPIFNATLHLEDDRREPFINQALADNTDVRDKVLELIEKNPTARVDRQGNLIDMSAFRPPEVFTLSIKLALIAGLIVSFPLILYFIAQFVFPGLTQREKRAIMPAIAIGFGLFLVGVVFAYLVVTPQVLKFFHSYGDDLGVWSNWRIGEYISFVSQLILIFGLSFELPVIVMTLVKLGLLSFDFMNRNRSYAIIIIFAVGALITPTPDAFTLLLLAGPLVVLYEICIWLAFFINRKDRRAEAQEEAERARRREARAAVAAGTSNVKLPSALPTGTLPQTDESAREAFDENDAMLDDEDDVDYDHDAEEYEEGFEPKDDSVDQEEDPDPYSSYDFHTEAYEESSESSPDERARGRGISL